MSACEEERNGSSNSNTGNLNEFNGVTLNVNSNGNSVIAGATGAAKSAVVIDFQPKRRVSIASETQSPSHNVATYDNPAFEQHPRRKVSQTSINSHGEIGPVRKKSILKDPLTHDNDFDHISMHSYVDNNKIYKNNAIDILHSKINAHYLHGGHLTPNSRKEFSNVEQSWLYTFCLKCRGEESLPSWEPPYWQKICPYPLCPSFRQFSRLLVLILIGILIWLLAYIIIGPSAGPGSQLFSLIILTVVANFGGYLIITLTTLPRLIGMLLVGIIFQNLGWVNLDGDFSRVTAHLRKFALAIILIRAGLEMEPDAFKKVYRTILKLSIIPWIVEFLAISVATHFLLDLPWIWSLLLASIIAAVSPAVIVPCLFRLRVKGYGVAKGIPTLIVAIAGIDDAISVAIFGIICTILFTDKSIGYQIAQVPVCIIGGLGFGIVWGNIARIFPEKGDSYVVPLRTITLFAGALVAIYGSEHVGFEGAGPLAAVFCAFVSNLYWCKQGWSIEDNPVATGFEICWMIFEPILFSMTGATVKFYELDTKILCVGVLCVTGASLLRMLITGGIAFGDRFNAKEKVFIAIACMAKATVQAALGPVALKSIGPNSNRETQNWANIVQTICVLSIVLTAPLGAILMSVTGTKLLTRTKQQSSIMEGWRRSHRPSIRDISIIDEEEEREEPSISDFRKTEDNIDSVIHIPSSTNHQKNTISNF